MKYSKIACALVLSAGAASAQEVELYSSDGSVSLRGPLIEYIDQKYTIDTLIGRLTLDSASVLCKGDACPDLKPPISEFSIVGVDMVTSKFVSDLLLPAYAKSLGAQIKKAEDPGDETYELSNADEEVVAKISLIDTTFSESASGLQQQEAAIVLTSRSSLTTEAAERDVAAQAFQSSDEGQVIGLDALAIVTAESNPVDSIQTGDLAKVFSGVITNWSELGGRDAPIKLFGPNADSELSRLFLSQVVSSQDDEVSRLTQDMLIVENIAERVSADPNGIGYTYFSTSRPAKTLAIKGVCGLIAPSNSFTVKAEEYPLTQRYYAYGIGLSDVEHIDMLLSFIQSDAGQDIVSSYGLVDQRDTGTSISNQGFRLANAIAETTTDVSGDLLKEMVTGIIDSERLSITFRFETGANKMDRRAQADVVRLAEKLLLPVNANSVVHLMGFTDSVGDFDLNLELSLRRANQIRDALIEFDATLAERVSILASGFGETAPIACNETAQGRSINRHVEVWMGKNR